MLSRDRASTITVAAFVTSSDDREEILRAIGAATRVEFCSTARQLVATITHSVPQLVVTTPPADSATDPRTLGGILLHLGAPPPVLVRTKLSLPVIRESVRCHREGLRVVVSLVGSDSLTSQAEKQLLADPEPAAQIDVIAAVVEGWRDEIAQILCAAALVGDRRSSVRHLADVSGRSTRGLEDQLLRARLLPPKPLLMWMLTLHTSWRVSRLG